MTTINFELYNKPHTADVRVLITPFINGDGESVIKCQCIISTIDDKPLQQIERDTDDVIQYYALSHAAREKAIKEYKRVALL